MRDLVLAGIRVIRREGWQAFFVKSSTWLRARFTLRPARENVATPTYLRIHTMALPTVPPDQFTQVEQSVDYVRYATLGLAVQRVLRDNILGDMAEAGVYRGQFARFIHMFAPDRVLYLFDTFEGFSRQKNKADTRFRDTSVEKVRKIVGTSSNIVIKKGVFPSTTKGLENNRFAFVSLDMDKYEAMLEGWRFFYPRMSKGGFIFVHDFNSTESQWGTYRATTEFLSDKPEKIIELPDRRGSALIRKV